MFPGEVSPPGTKEPTMIEYKDKERLFFIKAKGFSYVFYVNEAGMLQHLYAGKDVGSIDIKALTDFGDDHARHYLKAGQSTESVFEEGIYLNHSLFEIGCGGKSDLRSPTFLIGSNGDYVTDFRYASHSIYKGRPSLGVLPHFRDPKGEAETLEIILKEERKNIQIRLSYTVFAGESLIVRNTEIINTGKEKAMVRKASSLCLDFPSNRYEFLHFPGDWAYERQCVKEELKPGLKVIESKSGRSSHDHSPFFFLGNKLEEDHGEVFGFSFLWSGNFKAEIGVYKQHDTRVDLGMGEMDYSLDGGESLVLPEAVVFYSSEGLASLTHTIHDAVRKHVISIPDLSLKESIVLNSWEGCYMDFDTEKILSYLPKAKAAGCELFVLDDGWFKGRNDDGTSLGDWTVDEKKIDLNKVIGVCHELGMKFGLWFEPEMVSPLSDLYTKHHEYAIGDERRLRTLTRHQLALDMANPEVEEEVFEQMDKVLSSYDIDYVKWDHNRALDEQYSPYLARRGKLGNFAYESVLGYYRLISRLEKQHPGILFQGCASGGGRYDLGTLYYFPEIWASDELDPVVRAFILYGTSFLFPLVTFGAHVGKNPITPFDTKAALALFGTYGYELDPTKLKEEDIVTLKKHAEIFHKYHKEVVSDGDFYRLSSPYTENALGIECLSKDKKKALVFYMTLLKENRGYRFLKIKGLEENKLYYNDFEKTVHSGSYYQNIGINLSGFRDEFQSNFIILEEVKDA